MRTFRTVQISMRALRRNVMRSVLTTLGIIIGVAAVIAMMELGKGSSESIQKKITSMGANTLMVLPGAAVSGGINYGTGSITTLTPDDAQAILRDCPAVADAAPIVNARVSQVIYNSRNAPPTSVTGTTPNFLRIRQWTDLASGAPFSDQDVRNRSKVCLIGQTILKNLFPNEDPVGKEIRVQNVNLKIIGVLSTKGLNMMGRDQDDVIVAPWTTIKYSISGSSANQPSYVTSGSTTTVNSLSNLYPSTDKALYPVPSATEAANTPQMIRFANVDQILCAAATTEEVPTAIDQITKILHDRHRIQPNEPNDFNIRDMAELAKVFTSTSAVMTNLLLFVALISLIVGGVGIMNIMLVSVTERTREIGLRMAVGARGWDILQQFLIEAVVLCLAGGAIGILLGRGGSLAVRTFLNWPTIISIPAIIAAVAVSASVGIIFGFYPAWKASRLDPIEALRYE